MEKKTYETGLWSIRENDLLTWGNGNKQKSHRFNAGDTINDVPPAYHAIIRKAGHTPDMFCSAGSEIITRTLIPEIEACIDAAKQIKETKKAHQKAELEAAKINGVAFRTAEITAQYGAELCWARRLTDEEKKDYADWYQDLCMVGFAGDKKIKVDEEAIRQVIGDRNPDGQFNGCSNYAWTITAEEWDKIIALNTRIMDLKAKTKEEFEAWEAADIKHKIETGYCFNCETWCHGACGNYSNDPNVMHRRNLVQAIKEQNYGIKEG